ncbi:MAG: rRNA maturation RNase YbeY [Candidatus Omnitrophota bacterium]
MIKIKITNNQKIKKVHLNKVTRWAKKALTQLKITNCELSIMFVTDREITKLNRKYLKRNYPTDVLAFRMQEGLFLNVSPDILGDVVISVETAQRVSRQYRVRFEHELCLYLLHGILHLIGYRDNTKKSRRILEQKQQQIQRKLTNLPLCRWNIGC